MSVSPRSASAQNSAPLRERCIVIPAVKKSAVIPDQLVKKLAGVTLMQRALNVALQVAAPGDVLVVTDSDEIRLICERAGVGSAYDPAHAIHSPDIVAALRPVLETLPYRRIIIYRASSPLITGADIEDAYARFTAENSDCLVTLKSVRYRLWEAKGQNIDALLLNHEEQTAYVETKGLFMLTAEALAASKRSAPADDPARPLRTTPYFLHDRGLEINSYQDWWICEKILQSRHIVFVVAGYPAIGMGHIYRALMLAHEISDHRITFLCTRESELAAANIAARDYKTRIQKPDEDLAAAVLRLKPDLVINDILNTGADYIRALKSRPARAGISGAGHPAGARESAGTHCSNDAGDSVPAVAVVNFEDEGPGAALADLVVNALYERSSAANALCGPSCFCLRDEFLLARRNAFRPEVRRVLVTFGGTDASDYTRATLEALLPVTEARGIAVSVVTGPGYAHKDALAAWLAERASPLVGFTHATNVMSREMEDADLAVCSAGRTVYELAHMRIPALVIAHHSREDMHTFARPRNGFLYLGVMEAFAPAALVRSFLRLLDKPGYRRTLYDRLRRFDFSANKARVVRRMLALLP